MHNVGCVKVSKAGQMFNEGTIHNCWQSVCYPSRCKSTERRDKMIMATHAQARTKTGRTASMPNARANLLAMLGIPSSTTATTSSSATKNEVAPILDSRIFGMAQFWRCLMASSSCCTAKRYRTEYRHLIIYMTPSCNQ